jgi:hypothetical protein
MLSVCLAISLLILCWAGWYLWWKHSNRRRASEILQWVEATLGALETVEGVTWATASQFSVRLRMGAHSLFRNVRVKVELLPKHLPHKWLLATWRGMEETVRFEADFDTAPRFSLDLHNLRLFARTRRDLELSREGFQFESLTPLVLTTRTDWRREISGVLTALVQVREKGFTDLRFSRRTPHYVVVMPLQMLAPGSQMRFELAHTIREVAVEASSYHGQSY